MRIIGRTRLDSRLATISRSFWVHTRRRIGELSPIVRSLTRYPGALLPIISSQFKIMLLHDSENIFRGQNQMLDIVDFNFRSRKLRE